MPIIIDGTGTISGVSATGLTTAQTVGYSSLPAGSVLQVVGATYSTEVSSSSSTFSDTGLTATITPRFATSKILVLVHQSGLVKAVADNHLSLKLQRNGSDICNFELQAAYNALTTANRVAGAGCNFLDSPATTSSTTYKTVFNCNQNQASTGVQVSGSVSTITLMEIAG
jgi:hypothetical protein